MKYAAFVERQKSIPLKPEDWGIVLILSMRKLQREKRKNCS